MASPPQPTRQPAPAGWRASAWLVDTSLALVPAWLLGQVVTSGARADWPTQIASAAQAQVYLQLWLALALTQLAWMIAGMVTIYGVGSVLAEGGVQQATWGKRWLGLEVVDLQGRRIEHSQAALRFAAGGLSWLTLNAGHAIGAFRKDRRMLHDLVARTQVIMDGMEPAQRRVRAVMGIAAWALLGLVPVWLTPDDPLLSQAVALLMQALSAGAV